MKVFTPIGLLVLGLSLSLSRQTRYTFQLEKKIGA
jgi:hypothetical protein